VIIVKPWAIALEVAPPALFATKQVRNTERLVEIGVAASDPRSDFGFGNGGLTAAASNAKVLKSCECPLVNSRYRLV
jgi:hypothetical protein